MVAEVAAVDEQLARGQARIERFIRRDDEKVHVRVVAGEAFGEGTADYKPSKLRVTAVGADEPVDGALVVVADLHV